MKINFTTALTAAALFAIPLTVTACDQKTTETKKETTTTTTAPAATPAPAPDSSTTTTTTTEKKGLTIQSRRREPAIGRFAATGGSR